MKKRRHKSLVQREAFMCWVPTELHAALRQHALITRRTQTAIIVRALQEYLRKTSLNPEADDVIK